jgi:hypothetical protein
VPESAAKEAPVPVIVNETFRAEYFPKVNPLGVHFGGHEADPAKGDWAAPGWEIWGVVSDAKYQDLRSPIDPADRPRSLFLPISNQLTLPQPRRNNCAHVSSFGRRFRFLI